MTEKTLTTENIKPALDALRGELAPWPVVAKKQDRLNTAQLNAANSGITSSLVAQIIANTAAIRALESAITGTGLRALVVASLPAVGTTGILYIVPVTTYDPDTDADVVNYSNEYIWIPVEGGTDSEGHYEQVGQTGIVINNGQLTITVNGTSVGTFTANQSGDTTAAITVPTNADYVDRTTDQTVAGVKTFSSTINGTAAKAIADEDGTSIKTGYVNVAGNQTVTGDKSFTGSNTFNTILPNATNTYSLGSSSYQWSSVYAQTYYYNGTAWGLDKANEWTGANTFTAPSVKGHTSIINDSMTLGTVPASTLYNGYWFKGSTSDLIGSTDIEWASNGTASIVTRLARNTSGASRELAYGFGFAQTGNGIFRVYGDCLPGSTNEYNLGSSSYQWSSVYAQSYYYNGAAWGLDQANVWSKLQTFRGEYLGREYTINYCTCFGICGNNDTLSKSGMFFTRYRPNKTQGSLGSSDAVQYGVDVLENEVNTTNVFDIRVSGYDSNTGKFTKTEVISTSTDANLGTSTYKWKTINGCEPSVLGEVYVGNEVTIDTTNWVLDGSTWNTLNTSIMSGWVYLAVSDCDADSFILFRRGSSSKQKSPTVGFHPNLTNTGTYYLYGLFMVPKNTVCSILIRTGTNGVLGQALLYPCFGNV